MFDAEVELSHIMNMLQSLRIDTQPFGEWETRALEEFNGKLKSVSKKVMEYLQNNEARISQIEEKLEWLKSLGL
jgi:hypothetical protein